MSEEIKTKEVMNNVSTVEKKIESIVFKTLKDKIKGHIFVKMEEKVENEVDTLYVKIESNNIVYTEYLKLPGNTFEMVSTNEDFAGTLGLIIFDNFKKYIDNKFFVQDKPKKFFKK